MAKRKKENRQALESNQTAGITFLANQWQEHPVVGLTPAKLHKMLTEGEQGHLATQADLWADMIERDGHIFSEMDKRIKGVNSLPWGIHAPKRATDQERKIAEEVHEWIDDIENFEMFLFDAMDAVGHGYSCQEIEWQQLGNIWLPKSFEHINPRHFLTPYDQPNTLRINDGSMMGCEFNDFGWFVHQHKAKSGYIARSGLNRILAWPFLFKNYGTRDVMEFLEIYGLPIRIGQYPSGATQDEKMTLARAVMSIGRNAGGIIPQGMKIDFETAANGDTKNHFSLIDWCEKTASKIIVGGTLLSQADGKTSTHAQSKTHEVQFDVIKKSDSLQLARSINDSLISYLMRLNYPNITPDRYPKFYFDTTDTEDLETFSKSVPALVDIGVKIPTAWVHQKLGIPEPENDTTPILQRTPATPNLAANTQRLACNNSQQTSPIEVAEAIAIRGQTLLDDQIATHVSNEQLQHTSESLIPQLIANLSQEHDIDAALALLSEAYPEQDLSSLQDDLEQLMFASDALGRLITLEGRNRG